MPIPGSKAVAKIIQQQIKTSYKKKANLDSTKKALEKALKEVKKKIVIVIDDIDRLTNTQIRDIFQLVKSVGELPYIIYVLAMDREIVERALTEVHQTDGSRYLEKIIQNITTLRDVNRLVNIFRFRYGMLQKEVSFEDMLGITTLAVFEPKLYLWIYNNKTIVCKGSYPKSFKTTLECHQFYEEYFTKIGINSKRAIDCIAVMFPAFNDCVYANFESDLYLEERMRIGAEEKFELYFENIKFSRRRIDKVDLNKLIDELRNISEEEAKKWLNK